MSITSFLTDSSFKVTPDCILPKTQLNRCSFFKNEPYSFQLIFNSDEVKVSFCPVFEGDFPLDKISVFTVGYVPVTNVSFKGCDGSFVGKTAGMYPDVLFRHKGINQIEKIVKKQGSPALYIESREDKMSNAVPTCRQSLWITLNEKGVIKAGDYKLKILLKSRTDFSEVSSHELKIHIIDDVLPEQSTRYTNWLHYDVICDMYKVRMFSKRHLELVHNYLENATLHGMDTLYVPFFTPPLDTAIGKERMTSQLVRVEKIGDKYKFDFSLAEQFIKMAQDCGIKYFEHTQLYSQWGAYHSPKVMAKVGKNNKKIFGWKTDASGKEYTSFLKQYLKAFRVFTEKLGISDKMIFHISDEPACFDKEMKVYIQAWNNVKELLEGFFYADTLSEYEDYIKTEIEVPIARVPAMPEYSANCKRFWVYYTGGHLQNNSTNRIITTTSPRCRILGVEMYYYGAEGFMHWGYNYYYDILSLGKFNPYSDPCGYEMHPGTSYLCYPNFDGTVNPSLREKTMAEAMCDIRALQKLESLVGRDTAKAFCDDYFGGISVEMKDSQIKKIVSFREKLNAEIEKNL